MSADVFTSIPGSRCSKRKPAPPPPPSPFSARESPHVLASELTQCDVKGWLYDEVRGLPVWVVVADMLFCVFDSEESEISRNVVMLPGCRIRPVIFKSAPPEINAANMINTPTKTITGIDKYQFLIDDVSTRRKLLFGVKNRSDLDIWLDVLVEAVSMDFPTESFRSISDSRMQNDDFSLMLDLNGSYLPSPHVPRKSEKPNRSNILQIDSNATSLIDISRQRIKRDLDSTISNLPSPNTPMKARHSSTIETPSEEMGSKKTFLSNLKSFGSLESLISKPRRSRSVDDSDISERRSLDDNKNFTPPSPCHSDGYGGGQVRFQVLESGTVSKGIGPVVRRQVSDIKDKFFNGSSLFVSAPGVRLGELLYEKMCGFLEYRVMMKWIKVWCIISRGCFYGFKTQGAEETPIVAVVLKHCVVSYETGTIKNNKEKCVLKLAQAHCKGIYLAASNDHDLRRWLKQLKLEASGVLVDDNISIENSSDCTQSYDSAFSNVSVTSSQNEFTDKPSQTGGNVNGGFSPRNDEVFHGDSHLEDSPEEWDNYSNESQNDTISELNDVFTNPAPVLHSSTRKDKGYLLHVLRSKLKMGRKKSLPEPITERELSFSHGGGGLLMVDNDKTAGFVKGSAADIRRSKSFSAQTLTRMSTEEEPDGNSSTHGLKIHKPMCVKPIPADTITHDKIHGYLERRNFNGDWIKYWFILKDSSLYCYLTPTDTVTVDVIALPGYQATSLVDRFRGKRYVILLSHEEFLPLYVSSDNKEDLDDWVEELQSASQTEGATNHAVPATPVRKGVVCDSEQTEMFRRKLLAEVLRQKETLERQKADRQKKLSMSSDDLLASERLEADEQICTLTRLKQRRMSTQLKLDSLQKQFIATNGNKKSIFHFGRKKPMKDAQDPYVTEQLKELSNNLERIDRDLEMNGSVHNARSKLAALSHNSKSFDCLVDTTDKGVIQRSNSLKSSMQKLAHKTFIKAAWNKRRKSRNLQSLSSLDSDESHSSLHSDPDVVDLTKGSRIRSKSSDRIGGTNCNWSLSSDSDLNRSSLCLSHQSSCEHSPRSPHEHPMSFELLRYKGMDNVDGSYTSSSELDCSENSKNISNSSPRRRQVDPSVLAEIEAFEEMTRQMLIKMNVTPPL